MKGLAEVVVGTGFETGDAVGGLITSGEDDDREALAIAAHVAQYLEPIAPGHAGSQSGDRSRIVRALYDEPCFSESDEEMARHAFVAAHPRAQGLDWDRLKVEGWQRLNVPGAFAPFAEGNFPTPSGKCEFYSETLARQGVDPLPTYIPPRESVASNPMLAHRYPLAMLSPPARNALNSSFANLPVFAENEATPRLEIHPDDARVRGIASGDPVRVFNDRGALVLTARVTDRARCGVVVALSIWWRKLSPDGTNANMVTGQALTDLGRAATFYDCLVEVARIA